MQTITTIMLKGLLYAHLIRLHPQVYEANCFTIQSTVIIRLPPPPPWGAYSKVDLQERGLIREGGLFERGGLFKRQENMLQKGLRNTLKY